MDSTSLTTGLAIQAGRLNSYGLDGHIQAERLRRSLE